MRMNVEREGEEEEEEKEVHCTYIIIHVYVCVYVLIHIYMYIICFVLSSGWDDGKIRAFLPESGKPVYTIHNAHGKVNKE